MDPASIWGNSCGRALYRVGYLLVVLGVVLVVVVISAGAGGRGRLGHRGRGRRDAPAPFGDLRWHVVLMCIWT